MWLGAGLCALLLIVILALRLRSQLPFARLAKVVLASSGWVDPVTLQRNFDRQQAWQVLKTPAWMMPGFAQSAREGAAVVLYEGVHADEADRILAGDGAVLGVRMEGLMLGATWLQQPTPPWERIDDLLEGNDREQALVLYALPVLTFHRLDQSSAAGVVLLPAASAPLSGVKAIFGLPADELLADWHSWLGENSERSLAAMRRRSLLAYRQRLADGDGGILQILGSTLSVPILARPSVPAEEVAREACEKIDAALQKELLSEPDVRRILTAHPWRR
jgi:hypothetical protein